MWVYGVDYITLITNHCEKWFIQSNSEHQFKNYCLEWSIVWIIQVIFWWKENATLINSWVLFLVLQSKLSVKTIQKLTLRRIFEVMLIRWRRSRLVSQSEAEFKASVRNPILLWIILSIIFIWQNSVQSGSEKVWYYITYQCYICFICIILLILCFSMMAFHHCAGCPRWFLCFLFLK